MSPGERTASSTGTAQPTRTAEETPAQARGPASRALYFYGVARPSAWRGTPAEADGVVRIHYREVEALARPAGYEVPPLDESAVHAHQRVVEAALRRGTVLPAPYGIVFRDRRALLAMLQDQYIALDEGLSFLDGHWELRVHVLPATGPAADATLNDMAMRLYSELRRGVRAAVPFAAESGRLLSAAFLVDRTSWLEFMHHAEDLGAQHPELMLDITGPWPPYDFVRLVD
jgi:hypothetical protein